MAKCTKCGSVLKPDKKFCTECGAPMGTARTDAMRSRSRPSSAAGSSGHSASIQDSLKALGISLPKNQLVGFVLSIVAGMIVARILPYIYAPTVGTVLSIVGIQSPFRDSLNSFLMTSITFLTSFILAFIFSRPRQAGSEG